MKQYHPYDHCSPKTQQEPTAVILRDSDINHSKSPTCKPSSCRLSKMLTCAPVPACQLLNCSTVLFKVLYCKIKNVLFFVFVFLCTHCLCKKCYKPVTVQYYTADCVRCVPRLTLLDFWTSSQNGTRPYAVDLWYVIPFTRNAPKRQIRVRKQVGSCLGQGSLGGKGQWLLMGMG